MRTISIVPIVNNGRMTQRQVPDVRLLYFDACPNWRVAEGRIKDVLAGLGADPDRLAYEQVTTTAGRGAPFPRLPHDLGGRP